MRKSWLLVCVVRNDGLGQAPPGQAPAPAPAGPGQVLRIASVRRSATAPPRKVPENATSGG